MPAETPSGVASAAAFLAMVAAQVTAMAATAAGTDMQIGEAIADYNAEIGQVQARSAETADEANRRVEAQTKEGALALKERGAQSAFDSRMAMIGAERTASGQEARLGASGARAMGSPLLAAQQNVDIAFAAADRTVEKGNAGMKLGGLQLESGLAGIRAQETLATNEYGRQITEATRQKTFLEDNRPWMVLQAGLGGLPGLASTFYKGSSNGTFTWGDPSKLGINA